MDNTVLPDFRVWISPPVVLGERMEKLLGTAFELGFDLKFDEGAAQIELQRINNNEAAEVEAASAAPAPVPENQVMVVNNANVEMGNNDDVEMEDNDNVEMEEPINENLLGYDFKSGPSRLISGDDRYKEHMDRAIKKDWQFAEEYRDHHMRRLGVDEQTFGRLQKLIRYLI